MKSLNLIVIGWHTLDVTWLIELEPTAAEELRPEEELDAAVRPPAGDQDERARWEGRHGDLQEQGCREPGKYYAQQFSTELGKRGVDRLGESYLLTLSATSHNLGHNSFAFTWIHI